MNEDPLSINSTICICCLDEGNLNNYINSTSPIISYQDSDFTLKENNNKKCSHHSIINTDNLIVDDSSIIDDPLLDNMQDINSLNNNLIVKDSPIMEEPLMDNNEIPISLKNNEEKWWIAILLGFIFAIVSSPAAYYITSYIITSLGGISLIYGPGPNFAGLLIHTLIFIIIVRIILW